MDQQLNSNVAKLYVTQNMLQILPAELIQMILEILPFRDILQLGQTCKQLYHATNDPLIWKRYLTPAIQATPNPKKASLEKIENCEVQFWHLHSKGLKPYLKLKEIIDNPMTGRMKKVGLIAQSINTADYIHSIIALLHPECRKLYSFDNLSNFFEEKEPIFKVILNILKKHEKVLLFFLKDPDYRKFYLNFAQSAPQYILYHFFLLAQTHHIIESHIHDAQDLRADPSLIETALTSVLGDPSVEDLFNYIAKILEQRQVDQDAIHQHDQVTAFHNASRP